MGSSYAMLAEELRHALRAGTVQAEIKDFYGFEIHHFFCSQRRSIRL
jgi:hypothetical protein